jgi:succinate-acetate transporter protein
MSVSEAGPRTGNVTREASATTGGNPALLGLPALLPGSLTLGLWLIGYLDTATLAGGMVPAITSSSGLFLLVACIWAARVGQGAAAAIFGTFAAFWLSFAFLLLGVINGWFGIATEPSLRAVQVREVESTFVLSWLIVFATLTVATLRLALAFTAAFAVVCTTLALVLGFVVNGNPLFATLGGITTFVFCAIYAYIFVDAMTQELGGGSMPMGAPIQR